MLFGQLSSFLLMAKLSPKVPVQGFGQLRQFQKHQLQPAVSCCALLIDLFLLRK